MNKNLKRTLLSYLIIVILILGVLYIVQRGVQNVDLRYTETNFAEDLRKGDVASIYVQQNAEVPTGTVELTMKDRSLIRFYISDVNRFQDIYNEIVEEKKLDVAFEMSDVVRPSLIEKMLPYMVGILAFAIIIIVIATMQSSNNSGGGTMMNFGRSKAQLISEKDNTITFNDVAGLQEEKEDLEEVVDFLKNPGKYVELGARIPKGILLVGPPGTGKTLLAKAVAGEANVPFFTISGSDFVEMFVGVGASRVRDLFGEAKRNSPCIIFIDEIDAVARRRGTGLGGGHDEREQTLNQMLVEMDGFSVNEGIIVLAATNRVDILDPAILRPGRFDRKIAVGKPDVKGREDILKVHTKNKPLSEEINIEEIARTTAGFAGADLENLMNESAIYAAKDNRKYIIKEDVDKAFIKVGIGTERKSRVVPETERRITAYHEAGHAILFHLLEGVGPVYTVSIIPTGQGAAGYTMPLPENDNVFNTKGKILQDIKVSLGGRIAEEMIMDDITTGASQDIKQATAAARAMVVKYGMSDELGLINYETDNEEETFVGRDIGHRRVLGEQTAAVIDKEVKRIVDECYAEAKKMLEENVEILHKCAERLLEKERIDRAEFEALFE
ncbi:MAG: ATP-dependent zinc metalloprotease FtsH [Bacteroidales bacterium]|nr:ATP-dependent zinc metalloprotease FtsH [Clostridium sp.]MCM1203338.1 ATP-dependent zinc metalloprotease FtsH [Bacteroidales bacterium]